MKLPQEAFFRITREIHQFIHGNWIDLGNLDRDIYFLPTINLNSRQGRELKSVTVLLDQMRHLLLIS